MPWWDPSLSDEEREALRRALLEDSPGMDLENLMVGELAGPATPDRPDLPPWAYRSFVQAHPEVPLSDLTRVRFPVLHFEGDSGVTSVDEELKPLPRSYTGPSLVARFVVDAEAVVRRYELEHEAGLLEWDHEARGIVHLRPPSDRLAVLDDWVRTLRPAPRP